MKKILVIYHQNCLDGFGAAYAAWLRFKDTAEYLPAHYGDPLPDVSDKDVFILDFSYSILQMLELNKLLASGMVASLCVLIDHHKTAAERLNPIAKDLRHIKLVIEQEKSGAVLAWEYFHGKKPLPKLLQHIQDRDLWQFKLEGTEAITTALYELVKFNFEHWEYWMSKNTLAELESRGNDLLVSNQRMLDSLNQNQHKVHLNGVKGLACNAPAKYASDLGHKLAEQSGTFGLIYSYNGEKWLYSLRSVNDFDVSDLAQAFAGGGHKNAAGFTSEYPFNLLLAHD